MSMRKWHFVGFLCVVILMLVLPNATSIEAKKASRTQRKRKSTHAAQETSNPPTKSARDDDPVIKKVRGWRNEAMRLNDKKQYKKAIEKLRESLTAMHHRVFGEGRQQITDKTEQSLDAAFHSQLLNDYGGVLIRAKEYEEAIDVLTDAIAMIERIFGESHPSYGLSLRSLADAYYAQEQYETAIETFLMLRKHIYNGLGPQHEAYVELHLKIAMAHKKLQAVESAVKTLKDVLEDQGEHIESATKGIGEVYMELATLQTQLKRLEEAQRDGETACAILKMRDGPQSLTYAFSLNALAGVKMAQNNVAKAYELLQDAHRIAVALYGNHHQIVKASRKTLQQVKARLDKDEL